MEMPPPKKILNEYGQRFQNVRTIRDGYLYALTVETLGAVLRVDPEQQGRPDS